MATTKIWTITDNLSRALGYISNPQKTEYSDLKQAMHYITNEVKTVIGDESTQYVTGVNCKANTALKEMIAVQNQFGNKGKNVAYHAYQSFKPGEISPELCHQIGIKLAKQMWGAEYQVLVATHLDKGHLHNHFVINPYNMWTGKKFNCNKGAYWKFRGLSDKICTENELSVIKNPKGKTPRVIYFAEKNNEPTTFNLMRMAIDYAIENCYSTSHFKSIMADMGYEMNMQSSHKYWTIRAFNSKKGVRTFRLGDKYTKQMILNRIYYTPQHIRAKNYNAYEREKHKEMQYVPKRVKFKGVFSNLRCVKGMTALYMHYCYLLGYYPKKRTPLSPEMKETWRHIDRISNQVRLIGKCDFKNLDEVHSFIEKTNKSILEVCDTRQKIYNKLRRCSDSDKRAELLQKRDDCTRLLKHYRKEKRVALTIIEDNPKIKENIRSETQAKNYYNEFRTKQRKRGLER